MSLSTYAGMQCNCQHCRDQRAQVSATIAHQWHSALTGQKSGPASWQFRQWSEDDIRRLIREEIARAQKAAGDQT